MKFQTPLTHLDAYELAADIHQRSREVEETISRLKACNLYWTRAGIKHPFWDPEIFEGLHESVEYAPYVLARSENLCHEIWNNFDHGSQAMQESWDREPLKFNLGPWEYPIGVVTQKVAKRYLNLMISDVMRSMDALEELKRSNVLWTDQSARDGWYKPLCNPKTLEDYVDKLSSVLLFLTYALNSVDSKQNVNQAMRHYRTQGGSYVCKY